MIGGIVTLIIQRRALEHDRNTRFIDLKRERYATLLRLLEIASASVLAIWQRRLAELAPGR